MKKLFGNIDLNWKKLIIFAMLIGIYTGIMAIIPITKDTSFRDISISFEWWILFGVLIIMNSKSPKDSALKCFIFFLISQPIIYLVQVPFNPYGFGIFKYYPGWFVWTLLTIPMGFIGYYLKKDKWWGLLILTPVLLFLGYHYQGFLGETISFFPQRLLSTLFCLATMIIYPICIFHNKTNKRIGLAISIIILIGMTFITINSGQKTYNTTILVNGAETKNGEKIEFDDNYKAYLKDSDFGKLTIVYEKNIEDYMINAEFKKVGETEVILESPTGEKKNYSISITRNSYHIEK